MTLGADGPSEASFRLGSQNALYNKGRILQLMWERQRARGGTVADGERAVAPAEIETACVVAPSHCVDTTALG